VEGFEGRSEVELADWGIRLTYHGEEIAHDPFENDGQDEKHRADKEEDAAGRKLVSSLDLSPRADEIS
jgi:hypothetical protein